MNTIDLEVQGMTCGACVKQVTQVLQPLTGVNYVEVDMQAGLVQVSGELMQGSDAFVKALTAAGYPAKLSMSALPALVVKKPGGGCCCGR